MLEKLTPRMQERLERWKKNTIAVKAAEKIRGVFVSRTRDYGDDLRDYEKKENAMWQRSAT